ATPPLTAYMRGERLHGVERVFSDEERMDERCIGEGGSASARNDRSNGAAFECGCDKVMAIETLPANCEKEIASRRCARVDGVAANGERTGARHACGRFEL